jgi:predicted phage replisome organizer
MADVKWIKLTVDFFDDEKILLISSMPDGYIIIVWVKLLCLAGKQNNSGVFKLSNGMPYTEKMLATIFRLDEAMVSLALNTFESFGMIQIVNDVITITNWGKHQNLDKIEAANE